MDSTNRNSALASALVEELARCGVRHAALAPGSRSTPLALALWRHPAIATVVHPDERCAGFLALGAAQAAGVPAVVLCTSGTAAANLHPAVAEASEAAVPLIVLTADRPAELRGIGAGQTIDQLKLYGGAVRWFCEVGTHAADDAGLIHFRSVACRAYAAARGEPRPGPVHLNVPFREPLAPVAGEGDVTAGSPLALEGRGGHPLTAVPNARPGLDEGILDEIAERLASLPRGAIVAGRQSDPALAEPVARLARALGYPILPEPTSQLRCGPHDRGLAVWAYDALARARPESLRPDVVLRVGDAPTSKALREWLGSPEVEEIVLDSGYGWNEPSRTARHILRGDVVATVEGLARRVERGPGEWTERWTAAGEAAGRALLDGIAGIEEATEPGAQVALRGVYEDGATVLTASSMPIRDQESFLPAGDSRVRFLCNRGANGIDGLVSTAAGIASATSGPVWAVLGDLALLHDSNGLLALREGAPRLRLAVLSNDGGGIFHFLPQAELGADFEALFATPSGVDISRLAAVHDLSHVRIERAADLAPALAGEARVVEVGVDRRRNVEVHERLFRQAADAVAATVGG